jgi:TolB protein
MKNWLISLTLLSLLCASLHAEPEDNMIVRLATEKKLMPLYLGQVKGESQEQSYLNQLRSILNFDLTHNGMTEVIASAPELDKILDSESFDSFNTANQWKQKGFSYVVKVKIKDDQLSARVLHATTGQGKKVDNLPITGEISHDRRQIHRLADAIYKALFNEEGIATTHILFTKKVPGKTPNASDFELWEMDYDGANARQLLKQSGLIVTPAYVPPKSGQLASQFVFVNYKNGQPKIFIGNLRDGTNKALVKLAGNQLMPAVSRQQDKVAFISDYTGNPDLFMQTFDIEQATPGKPQQLFTNKRAAQGTPTFSPDGKQVAFVSNKDGSPKIYVMNIPEPRAKINELKPKLITRYQGDCTAPNWSPDGKKIAYCVKTKGKRQIWVYDFDRKEEYQVTQGNENKENPSFAPNSEHIVYNTTEQGNTEIYFVSLNELKPVKITSGVGDKRFPSWEPR